jgi:outer membrane protein
MYNIIEIYAMRFLQLITSLLALILVVSVSYGQEPSAKPGMPTGDWTISIGASTITGPKYPGAKAITTLPIPYWDIDYKHRFFSNGLDFAGVYLLNDDTWKVGSELTYDLTERREKDDDRLKGLGNVKSAIRAKVFAEYTLSFFNLSAEVAQDISGHKQGMLIALDATFTIPFTKRWFFSLGPGITWGDKQYVETFFGVTQTQSVRSGLPPFNAESGVADIHLNIATRYSITNHWAATGMFNPARLLGRSADSPITETKNQTTWIVSMEYKF